VTGRGLPALIVSVLAGGSTLALVWWWRFEPARYTAALAVAAIVAGWALAQSPRFLPGLTVKQAAAPHDALVAVLVAILAGGALLVPALGTLFRLTLRGHLDYAEPEHAPPALREAQVAEPRRPQLLVRVAAALLIAGFGFLNVADAQWAHVLGAACLLGFVAMGFRAALPAL
jgi:cytochrome d ubiquinol oxidase subunit II